MSCKYCGNKGADNCFLNNIPKCWKPAKELEQRIFVIEEVNRNNGILIAEKNRKIKELKRQKRELIEFIERISEYNFENIDCGESAELRGEAKSLLHICKPEGRREKSDNH